MSDLIPTGVGQNSSSDSSHQLPVRFVAHSYHVASIGLEFGWLPGARYTNLRDCRRFDRLGFLDIDWKNYDFRKHLEAARQTKPLVTVARDIVDIKNIIETLDEAYLLSEHADRVILVPKDPLLEGAMDEYLPAEFTLGFSVPTRYGGTTISPSAFQRPVHLLGGRPDVQRRLGSLMNVVSIDCNRFTIDARFGDYFDGAGFRPHPSGGYEVCLRASFEAINQIWLVSDK